jgi:Spy/CpxP family protein refolding chaperone
MRKRRELFRGLAVSVLLFGAANLALAQEETRYSPDLEQLRSRVSDRLEAVAEKLGLSDEQKTKIREAKTAFADKFQAMKTQRRELLDSELKALGEVLTPEQRETAKEYIEDFKEAAVSPGWPEVCPERESLADRLDAAVEKLNLTAEQKTKIREAHRPFAGKYRAQRAEIHELVQNELKSISEALTPEQREKARNYVEARMVLAPAAKSLAHRIRTVAENMGISTEQLSKILETHRNFDEQYNALSDKRDQLLREELKSVKEILTPEQREKVSNFFADRILMVSGDLSRLDERQITQLLETIADRLEGVANKLGLSAEQKEKIKSTHEGFVPRYREQRDERRQLRQKELDAISELLSADQREKVKDFTADQAENPKEN